MTSTGMYSAGELYWNFGAAGVIGGMAIIGVLFGYLFSEVGPGPHRQVVAMAIFVNVLARIVDQASATELLVLLVYLIVLLAAYRYFMTVSARARSTVKTGRSPVTIRPVYRGGTTRGGK